MAVREFDGVDDEIAWSIGDISGMNYGAAAFIFKKADTATAADVISILTTGAGSNRAFWGFSQFNQHSAEWSPAFKAIHPPDIGLDWWLVVHRKATGTTVPSISLYNFSTTTWTHGTWGADTAADIAVASNDIIRTRARFGTVIDGRAAVSAIWKNNIPWANNAAVEAAGLEDSLTKWVDSGPTALWAFNQTDVTDPVNDLIGGADQTSRTGTTVINGDDPPGFDFSLAGPASGLFSIPWSRTPQMALPLRPWYLPMPYAEPGPTGDDIREITAESRFGFSGRSTASKISINTGVDLVGLLGLATVKKVTTETAVDHVGFTTWAVRVPLADITARGHLGLAGIATAKKINVATGRGNVGLVGLATAKKINVATARSNLGLAGFATAKKVGAVFGSGFLGLTANAVRVPVKEVTALGGLGLVGIATGKKVKAALAQGNVGLAGIATGKKINPAAVRGHLGLAGLSTVRKVAPGTARGLAGLTGLATAKKLAPALGSGFLGLGANAVRVPTKAITALGSLGLFGRATATKRSTPVLVGTFGFSGRALTVKISRSTGVGALGLITRAEAAKKTGAVARLFIGFAAEAPTTAPDTDDLPFAIVGTAPLGFVIAVGGDADQPFVGRGTGE